MTELQVFGRNAFNVGSFSSLQINYRFTDKFNVKIMGLSKVHTIVIGMQSRKVFRDSAL